MRAFALAAVTALFVCQNSAFAQTPPAAPSGATMADTDIIVSLNAEQVAAILQSLGYRAAVHVLADKSKDVATGMGGYNVYIYFYDCDANLKCTAIQYEVPIDKDPKFTISMTNTWNAKKRYSRLYINPDNGSLIFDYDLFIDGMTIKSFKESVSLCDTLVGDLKRFLQGQ